MKQDCINLSITYEQLELIENSVEDRRDLWRRTLEYHQGNESVTGTTEECSGADEAESVLRLYDDLYQFVQQKARIANQIEALPCEKLDQLPGTVEVYVLSRGSWEKLLYVYTDKGRMLFPSLAELVRFCADKEPVGKTFDSDSELMEFLRYYEPV